MWSLLFVIVAGPPSAKWEFRDAAGHDGRSLLTFRAVELGETPVRPLRAEERPDAKARYGLMPVGTEPDAFPAIVWLPEAGRVWLDADGDGSFDPSERHLLGTEPLELPLAITVRGPGAEPRRLKRTIVLRRAGDGGLRYAVRGYVAGSLRLGEQDYAALLADGNADGAFDSAAADRIWIDLNRDGRFDALTEQFPLGKPLTVGGKTYLLKPEPDGSDVLVRQRPADGGSLRLALTDKTSAKPIAFSAELVSDWGELVRVAALDQALSLPVGRYSVDTLTFQLPDAQGRKWQYRFGGKRRFDIEVSPGRQTRVAVLSGLALSAVLKAAKDGVHPGDDIGITPTLQTPGGVYLVDCQTCARGAENFTSGHADIRLTNARGDTLARTQSGLL